MLHRQCTRNSKSIWHTCRSTLTGSAKASKARQAQSRIKALERMEKVLPAQFDNPFSFEFREPKALPNPILMMDEMCRLR